MKMSINNGKMRKILTMMMMMMMLMVMTVTFC